MALAVPGSAPPPPTGGGGDSRNQYVCKNCHFTNFSQNEMCIKCCTPKPFEEGGRLMDIRSGTRVQQVMVDGQLVNAPVGPGSLPTAEVVPSKSSEDMTAWMRRPARDTSRSASERRKRGHLSFSMLVGFKNKKKKKSRSRSRSRRKKKKSASRSRSRSRRRKKKKSRSRSSDKGKDKEKDKDKDREKPAWQEPAGKAKAEEDQKKKEAREAAEAEKRRLQRERRLKHRQVQVIDD